ncbi:hypothetical protein SAMN05880592_102542 [Bosea sp. TND4EK4]|nr:hypothetical protein SAMN05880592_102542 [Bosea sp. TND4EK4]
MYYFGHDCGTASSVPRFLSCVTFLHSVSHEEYDRWVIWANDPRDAIKKASYFRYLAKIALIPGYKRSFSADSTEKSDITAFSELASIYNDPGIHLMSGLEGERWPHPLFEPLQDFDQFVEPLVEALAWNDQFLSQALERGDDIFVELGNFGDDEQFDFNLSFRSTRNGKLIQYDCSTLAVIILALLRDFRSYSRHIPIIRTFKIIPPKSASMRASLFPRAQRAKRVAECWAHVLESYTKTRNTDGWPGS